MNPTLAKVREQGYWHVVIRPCEFGKDRIPSLSDCQELVRQHAVHLRGWDFPHFDPNDNTGRGENYVEQFTNWEDHIEGWRMYQSGQFVSDVALCEDWHEEQTPWRRVYDMKPRQYLSILGALYTLTEAYEFASRLGNQGVLGDACEIAIALRNTKGREIVFFAGGRHLWKPYRAEIEELNWKREFATPDLLARSAELAMEHVVWLFERFGWLNVTTETLKEDQQKLLERRL